MQFQRYAVTGGAILYDPRWGGNAPELLFDRGYWRQHGRLREMPAGRGAIAILDHDQGPLVLRHYHRGGWAARCSDDRYLYTGEARARSFVELRLHAALLARGLPVPLPVAARYHHEGLGYEADLVTALIPAVASLAARLCIARVGPEVWSSVGACLARFHEAGLDHADLNAHNVLLGARDVVHLVDFDRGRLRSPGSWRQRNLRRLRTSLRKVTRDFDGRFGAPEWEQLLAGYAARAAVSPGRPR